LIFVVRRSWRVLRGRGRVPQRLHLRGRGADERQQCHGAGACASPMAKPPILLVFCLSFSLWEFLQARAYGLGPWGEQYNLIKVWFFF
jgi:hypothetical protein